MTFKKEIEKFNKLVAQFEKNSMRICKRLESLALTLDSAQEDYLGNFRIIVNVFNYCVDSILEKAEAKLMKPIFQIENLFCEVFVIKLLFYVD